MFLFVLLFGTHVRARLGLAGTELAFLDKACVRQCSQHSVLDADCAACCLKGLGIKSLTGFLKSSQNFVILFDPYYFTRLWCIYELAYFTKCVGPDGLARVQFLQLYTARLVVRGFVGMYVFAQMVDVFSYFIWTMDDGEKLVPVEGAFFITFGFLGLWHVCRSVLHAVRRHEDALNVVKGWTLGHAQCSVEADRGLELGQIVWKCSM